MTPPPPPESRDAPERDELRVRAARLTAAALDLAALCDDPAMMPFWAVPVGAGVPYLPAAPILATVAATLAQVARVLHHRHAAQPPHDPAPDGAPGGDR